MVQNHLLQLLALVAMEPPVSFSADNVRDEKVKVFRAVRPLGPEDVDRDVVRGQYGAGILDGAQGQRSWPCAAFRGAQVPGYRAERDVDPASGVETFVTMRLLIDNWRWAGVPFYLRTGKRLPRTATEIYIRFTRVPHLLFRGLPEESCQANELVLRIQPDEGISLTFGAKAPGSGLEIRQVTMDFSYKESFGAKSTPAYERLILDAIKGDASLFIRDDGVAATWNVVQPVLDRWASSPPSAFPRYPAGSWGPAEADELIARSGRRWCNRA
jgi:glucose-6-phosphate 1-dehydrogenase